MTSMWSDTKPIGHHDHPADALLGELLDPVVDVGLQPRHVRRAGPGAEHQLGRVAVAGLLAHPLRDLVGDGPVLGDVRRCPRGRHVSFIDVGTECVTNRTCASRRAASPRPASAVSVASTIGSTKPGWLK